jgi:hypothetical protein
MSSTNVYELPTVGGPKQAQSKRQLADLLENAPKQGEELIANLGLYTRSVILAKYLYLNELYQHIKDKPGVIMEFGVWWGANLALFGSLRAIHEPYNWTRKVIGFDTFEGYPETHAKDGASPHAAAGGYAMPENYQDYLARVLEVHEQDNVMDHMRKFELVKGEAGASLKRYLSQHPETVVSLAYLDMAMYEATREVLELLLPHMVKGGVIALDELGSSKFPGETLAFKEVIGTGSFRMVRSQYLPDRTIVIIE